VSLWVGGVGSVSDARDVDDVGVAKVVAYAPACALLADASDQANDVDWADVATGAPLAEAAADTA
jgi:hypothetical protein